MLNEAERILAKTSGGLSLHDRLKRDPAFREEMLDLLNDFKDGGFPVLSPLGKGKRKTDKMKDG